MRYTNEILGKIGAILGVFWLSGILILNLHKSSAGSGITGKNTASATLSALNTVEIDKIDGIVPKLIDCESGGRVDVAVLDTNNKYSYGILQFQLDTFYSFGKKYGILDKNLTKKEALNLIMKPSLQIKIARKMIENGEGGHWTCYKKIFEAK